MTTKQRSELDAAIERASVAGLEIIGRGRLKANNARVFLVPSQSQPGRAHCVVLVPHTRRLVCDCAARVLCVHKAVVHMALIVEAAKHEAAAAEIAEQLEIEQRDREEAEQQTERARKREAAILVHSNAPFSVWK
jgi:hypothetical protein